MMGMATRTGTRSPAAAVGLVAELSPEPPPSPAGPRG